MLRQPVKFEDLRPGQTLYELRTRDITATVECVSDDAVALVGVRKVYGRQDVAEWKWCLTPMPTCSTCAIDTSDYLGGTSSQCANCWEVERRLALYLGSPKGKLFVAQSLASSLELPKA